MLLFQGITYLLVVFILLFALAFVVFMLYLILLRRKYRHIPSPPLDSWILGHIPSIKKKRDSGEVFEVILYEMSLEYGDVFIIWTLHLPYVSIIGPELVKKVIAKFNLPKPINIYKNLGIVFGTRGVGRGLITECDHQVWLRKRLLLNPAFHRKCLMNLIPEFNLVCDKFIKRIGRLAEQDVAVNFADEFSRVTMDIIGKVAFNVDLNAIEDDNCPFKVNNYLVLKGMQEMFRDIFFWRVNIFTYPFQWKVIKAAGFVRDYGRKVITERIAAIKDGKDTPNDILQHIALMSTDNASVTLEDLVDEFVTFFFAGQETTANQLAFTLYEIEKNVPIKRRLVQEAKTVLHGKQFVSYADLGNLEYLQQTLKESLRLHPPASGFSRYTHEEIVLGGYKIPAKTTIGITIVGEHWSEDNWTNPKVFDPDRFADKNTSESFLPFSLGPRSCIGKNLAQFEAKVIMARLYQEFDLELVSPKTPMAYDHAITIRPKDGVWCKVRKRI